MQVWPTSLNAARKLESMAHALSCLIPPLVQLVARYAWEWKFHDEWKVTDMPQHYYVETGRTAHCVLASGNGWIVVSDGERIRVVRDGIQLAEMRINCRRSDGLGPHTALAICQNRLFVSDAQFDRPPGSHLSSIVEMSLPTLHIVREYNVPTCISLKKFGNATYGNSITTMASFKDNVFLGDSWSCVHVLDSMDSSAECRRLYGFEPDHKNVNGVTPGAMAIGPLGYVYLGSGRYGVQVYTSSGVYVRCLIGPPHFGNGRCASSLAVDAHGLVFVVREHYEEHECSSYGYDVLIVSPHDGLVIHTFEHRNRRPCNICLDSVHNWVCVSEPENDCVAVFSFE